MWSEAVEILVRAERMHRQMFQPRKPMARAPCWEPPVDLYETEQETTVIAALPGVDPTTVTVTVEDDVLLIYGQREFAPRPDAAIIHRMELPQGCFQRQVRVPPGRYDDVRRSFSNGCLVVTLRKHIPGAVKS